MGAVARVAGQQAGRNRTVKAAWNAVCSTAGSLGNVLHSLWLEVIGVIFLGMAMTFASGAVKEYGRYHSGQEGPGRLGVAIAFAAIFGWFGLSSFWRVRQKAKRMQRS